MTNIQGSIDNHDRLAWYREAKFGLFIHWGPYSAAGVEASWSMMAPDLSEAMFGTSTRISEAAYTALPARFNPVDFDADVWVRIAQQAGMRYIVFTSKHHDGFCMFDAPGTDYKITRTPFGRDVCLELAEACDKVGMPLGFYYSPPDMHHPGYRDKRKPVVQNWLGEPGRKEWGTYLDYMESHIRKLMTDYGDVRVLWFDGLANHSKYDPPRFHRLVHSLNPKTLINDRLGDDYDFITPEQSIPKAGIPIRTGKPPAGNDPGGDRFFSTVLFLFKIPGVRALLRKQILKYRDGTLELTPVLQEPYPPPERFQPWETCMTMGQTWGYNPNETTWKEPITLLQSLVEVASRGGNYLLNVGPTERGTFPPQAMERLQQVGRWMETCGESVYGSTYSAIQGLTWGRSTQKGNKIYLHIFNLPQDKKLQAGPFDWPVQAVRLITGEPLAFSQVGQEIEIYYPDDIAAIDIPVLVVE
jgi:alpha-L-fucosidase